MSARVWDRRRRKDRTVYLVWSGGWRDEDTVMAAFDREDDAQVWLAASEHSRLGRVEACPLNPPRPRRTHPGSSAPTPIPAADLYSLGWRQIAAAADAPVDASPYSNMARILDVNGRVHLGRATMVPGHVVCGYHRAHMAERIMDIAYPGELRTWTLDDFCDGCVGSVGGA